MVRVSAHGQLATPELTLKGFPMSMVNAWLYCAHPLRSVRKDEGIGGLTYWCDESEVSGRVLEDPASPQALAANPWETDQSDPSRLGLFRALIFTLGPPCLLDIPVALNTTTSQRPPTKA